MSSRQHSNSKYLGSILGACPRSKILHTTREPCWSCGRRVTPMLGGARDLVCRLNAAGAGAIGFIYYSDHLTRPRTQSGPQTNAPIATQHDAARDQRRELIS